MIVNPETKAKVLRYAMGNPGNLSITKLAVALDYDAVDALGVRFKDTVNLEVRRARALGSLAVVLEPSGSKCPTVNQIGRGWRCVGSHGLPDWRSSVPLGINQ